MVKREDEQAFAELNAQPDFVKDARGCLRPVAAGRKGWRFSVSSASHQKRPAQS